METRSGVVLLSLVLFLLLLAYIYKIATKNHNYFQKRGIESNKATIFFGNKLEALLEQEEDETIVEELYKKFRNEK